MEKFPLPESQYQKSWERLNNFIERLHSNVVLVFHRHLEHVVSSDVENRLYSLSNEDLNYAEDVSNLTRKTDLNVTFSVDNLRSYLTSYFILKPEEILTLALGSEDQVKLFEKIKTEHKHTIRDLSSKLSYKDTHGTEFDRAMDKAFKDLRPLDFQVKESDGFRERGEDISSYSFIASEISGVILKYFKIKNRRHDLSEKKYGNKNLFRTFCAREFIYACFRAKITEKVLGKEERDKYIKYFSENRGSKFIGIISFSENGEVVMEDDFGELACNITVLEDLILK